MNKIKVKLQKQGSNNDIFEMSQSLNQIFAISDSNKHIYLFKVLTIYKYHNRMLQIIKSIDQCLFKGKYIVSKLDMFTAEEQQMNDKLKQIEDSVFEVINVGMPEKVFTDINQVDKLVLTLKYNDFDPQIQDLQFISDCNDYLQGTQKNTIPYVLTSQYADINRKIGLLQNHMQKGTKHDIQTEALNYLRSQINKDNEQILIYTLPLHDYIQNLLLNDDYDEVDQQLKTLNTCLELLKQNRLQYYEAVNIPEFEPNAIKDMVRQTIGEFKKNLKDCGQAFSKLEKSLDTFTENFGQYYENFQINNKEPSGLFLDFIGDVSKEYEDTDKQEGRKILIQFKKIQREFAKRLGSQLNNPHINQLYTQLQKQMGKASKMMNMQDSSQSDDQEEGEQEQEEKEKQQKV